jgi:hypothetical protein
LKAEIESLQKDNELGADMGPSPHAISGAKSRSDLHDPGDSEISQTGPAIKDLKR